MKKIEATIRPERLDDVREAVSRLGITEMTVFNVRGEGIGQQCRVLYRCAEHMVGAPRLKVELVVGARQADDVIQAILDSAWTGESDDGQVYVSEVAELIRVSNRQRDEAAV